MDSHHVFLEEPDGRSQRKFWEREPWPAGRQSPEFSPLRPPRPTPRPFLHDLIESSLQPLEVDYLL